MYDRPSLDGPMSLEAGRRMLVDEGGDDYSLYPLVEDSSILISWSILKILLQIIPSAYQPAVPLLPV